MGTEVHSLREHVDPDVQMRELIQHVACGLVDHPDQVQINEIRGATTTVYELTVSQQDVGKLIGRGGRTLRAFRTLVSAVSTKLERKTILEVIE